MDRFREKSGRKPGPGDTIFFNPDEDTPQLLDLDKVQPQMIMTMIKADMPHALIYACMGAGGMVLSEENEDAWDE